MNAFRMTFAALVALLMTACGGGGEESPSTVASSPCDTLSYGKITCQLQPEAKTD